MSQQELQNIKKINNKTESKLAVLKYVIIGDSNVGKSNIILRYCEDSYKDDFISTVGGELNKKSYFYEGIKVKEQIWDTAGQEKFQSVTSIYYKGAHGALCVFDISKRESFENLNNWIYILRQQAGEDVEIFIIGNKVDLDHKREVDFDEAKEFSEREGNLFLFCLTIYL
jgi:small GTP-binding protein